MTRPQQKAIGPEQWDFRSLSENELYAAAKYEYARALVSPAQARKARTLLNKYDKTAPIDMLAALPSMDEVPPSLMFFAQKFPKFPLPWLKLPHRTRTKYVKQAGRRMGIMDSVFDGFITATPSPVELEVGTMVKLIESEGTRRDSYGIYSWHFAQINWGQSDKQIIADFKRWLKGTRPKGVKPVVVKGKKAQPDDHHLLKWLAAARLDATGMNFTSAQQHVKKHVGTKLEDPNDVLPIFAHASGWHAVVKKAAKLIASRRV